MGIIYKITNTVNGHSYIGQTRCSLQKRWNEHIRDSKRCDYKFHRAIRKYGENAFHAEIIETVPDDQLDDREIYWVDYYDTYHNGYNSTLGGNVPKYVDSGQIIELWDNGLSVKEIIKELGYSSSVISNRLQGHDSFSHEESLRRGHADIQKRVCQYDLNGNYIQTFDSINIAARHYHVDRSLISACCRNKIWSGAGYLWRFESDDHPGNRIEEHFMRNGVIQYDLDGNYVNQYNSIHEASIATETCASSISNCCSKKVKTANRFQWRHVGDNAPGKYINYARKPVLQYDKAGELLREFDSIANVERSMGFNRDKISKCCSGSIESAYGYVWKYAN